VSAAIEEVGEMTDLLAGLVGVGSEKFVAQISLLDLG
jgi:hypothetical protein